MSSSSSPSIAMTSGGVVQLVFRGSNGNLWFGNNGPNSGVDTGRPILSGTSPSIAVGGPSNRGAVAFHGTNNNLWFGFGTVSANYFDTGCPMQTSSFGTYSPSVAVTTDGTAQVAFQSSNGNFGLYTNVTNPGSCSISTQPMASLRNPTIIATPSGGFQASFKGSNGNLQIDLNGAFQDQGLSMN